MWWRVPSTPTPAATAAAAPRSTAFAAMPAADRDASAAAEERAERGRERYRTERLQRRALRALGAGEGRALGALAEVRAQAAPLRAGQPTVELARDRELGLDAGERLLELLAEGAAGAEEQRLDRADGGVEDLGDLGVGATLELAHDERGALVEGEVAERAADLLRARALLLGLRLGELLVERDLVRAARRLAEALPADVVGDRDQPVPRRLRPLAALVGAVGVHERRLRDVLGVVRAAQHRERVAVDVRDVLAVEALERAVGRAGAVRAAASHPNDAANRRVLRSAFTGSSAAAAVRGAAGRAAGSAR